MLVLLAVLWGLIGRRLFAPYEMQTEPVDPSLHTATQTEFWNGDWYGWWIIESGTGDYALSEGGWWDACARIDLGEDGSGTLTLWDDSCEAGEYIAQASVQAEADLTTSGRLVSTGGSFLNCPLTGADAWYIDAAAPESMPYHDMICISGVYTDPEGSGSSFVYTIYLRPWGMDWEDVRADNESLLPYFYDDWYLPLIDAGKSMPDSIGADAPAGSGNMGTTTSNPGGETSGGDGIVTEEQVQKGYVWMNEVNKNIFDATYDDIAAYFGVKGQFVKEEYSDHMKANYRYYKWISEDDESHFIYVNFKKTVSGVYTVSGFNTSGFSGKEAIARYLDTVKAEAAEAN